MTTIDKKIVLTPAAAAALMTVMALYCGCSAGIDEFWQESVPGGQIQTGVVKLSSDVQVSSTWEDGSTMTVQNIAGEEIVDYTFTYGQGIWTRADAGERDFLWPDDGSSLYINAFLNKTGADANQCLMPVSDNVIDQTTEAGLEACDFLYYTGEVPLGAALSFCMDHVMAKLVINVKLEKGFDAWYTSTGLTDVSFPAFSGMSRTDASSGWTAGGEKSILRAMVSPMEDMSQTITALVVPGNFDEEITLTVKNLSEEEIRLKAQASGFVLEGGKQYTVPMTLVNKDGILQAEIGNVTVTGWTEGDSFGNLTSDSTEEVVLPWDGTPATAYDGGDGTSENPYLISTPGQLALMRNQIREAKSGADVLSAHFRLVSDIDLNDVPWTPINTTASNFFFHGSFDGDGHSVSGLKVTSGDSDGCVGLFGYTAAEIKDLMIVEPEIVAEMSADISICYIAVVAARQRNPGVVENCHVIGGTVDVLSLSDSDMYAGSIVGQQDGGSIIACSSSASMSGASSRTVLGGITGFLRSTSNIAGCYTVLSLDSSGSSGGIVGQLHRSFSGIIVGCYADIDYLSEVPRNGGGIIGSYNVSNSGTLSANYSLISPPVGTVSDPVEGLAFVSVMDDTVVSEMNANLVSYGWQYVAAEDGGIYPYQITPVEVK